MAVVNILQPAFGIKWAQDGTVEAIDEAQWRTGWAFIGATPPSVEQFNKVHQVQDEKSNWLYQQMQAIFTAGAETPTVGDLNSLLDATRVVIRQMLGSYSEQIAITGNRILLNSEAGRIVNIGPLAGNTFTVTLPGGTPSTVGQAFQFNNNGVGTAIVQAPAGYSLFGIGNSTPRTFTLQSGDSVTVAYVGGNAWYGWGGVQLGASAGFASSLTATGYQKLPTGWIENSGAALAMTASEIRTITLPMAFLVGAKTVLLTGDGVDPRARVAALGTTTIQIQNVGSAAQNVYWRAQGN